MRDPGELPRMRASLPDGSASDTDVVLWIGEVQERWKVLRQQLEELRNLYEQ